MGRHADLPAKPEYSNVFQLPGAEASEDVGEPTAEHIAIAEKLKPTAMSPDAVKLWNIYAPHMVRLDRLRPIFVETFREYCECAGNMRLLQRKIKADKEQGGEVFYITITRNGMQRKMDPRVSQMNELRRALRGFIAQFGLAPASNNALSSGSQGQLDGFDDL